MVITQDFLYTPGNENRRLHIYLPPWYDQRTDRYPVVYFFDGQNLFHDESATYGRSWRLEAFLDSWVKPVIVVGMEPGHEGNERLWEYSPYHLHGKAWGGDIYGIGAQTMEWVVSEVKPFVDAHFRTWGHREATAIAGSSMGGLMSLYGVCVYNRVFSKAACLSSAVWSCMRPLERDIRMSEIVPDTRVYLSFGTKELPKKYVDHFAASLMARQNARVRRLLLEQGAGRCELYVQQGGRHCEEDWEKQNRRFMEFLWM